MSRTLTAGVAAAVQGDFIASAVVEMLFDSGAVRLWTGIGDLVFAGDTYTGAGTFGDITPIQESAALRANGITLTFSGASQALIDIAKDESVQGRTVNVWYAVFDANHALIADPFQAFAGFADAIQISDGGAESVITLTAENDLVDLKRPLERRYYTDEDQQREFPGDRFYEFGPAMNGITVYWGRRRLEPAAAGDDSNAVQPTPAPPPVPTPDSGIADPNSGSQNVDINTGLPVEGGVPGPGVAIQI